ncbi:MAG: FG-GAP repeat protein [Planctomycetota bacterium]
MAECEVAKLLASDGAVGEGGFGNSVAVSGDTAVIGRVKPYMVSELPGSAYIFRFDGSNWVEEQKLTASDGAANDKFGISVGISGDTAIIGAHGDDPNGSAYIFRFDGASWVEEAKLTASDGAAGDKFGKCVAISGDAAVIGAVNDDPNGSAYIFRFDGSSWVEEAKLTASDGAVDDWFGGSVGINGDTAVIGASGNDNDGNAGSGSAYIFRFDGSSWVEEAKLTASDGAADDWFGSYVGINGDTAVIGAAGDDDSGDFSGSAYIFRFDGTNWVEEEKLLASDGAADDWFGFFVGISGDTVVIGAYRDDDSGSVYIFRFNGSSWVEEAKLLASDGAADDLFGVSVGISGDTVVIGAPLDDDNGYGSGSAYIFKLAGAGWEEKLLASDGEEGDNFGGSVSISGDTAVIGAHYYSDANGSAYIFRFDGVNWVEEAKLLASDGAAYDYFGAAVGISGDTAVIGAYGDDDKGGQSGSVYIFRFDGASWVEEAKLLASDGATYDYFGSSIGISGDTAVIGASSDNSAYIFRFDGSSWVEEAKLLASDGASGDYFGGSVGISGDTAVIGAWNHGFQGSAYIFRFDGTSWVEEAKLLASDGKVGIRFGSFVGISGDTVVIGARDYSVNNFWPGSAYIFRFDGSSWLEEAKLLVSKGASPDWSGSSVGISGDTAVVGAVFDDGNGGMSGSAYLFRFDGSNWGEEAKLLASDGAEWDNFGYSVAISGDTAVIGARWDDDNGTHSGSAYIFGLSMNAGDLDLDNDVDFYDFCVLAEYWLETECGLCECDRADFTGDGQLDNYDLEVFANNWLKGI